MRIVAPYREIRLARCRSSGAQFHDPKAATAMSTFARWDEKVDGGTWWA